MLGLGLKLDTIKIISNDHVSIWDTTKTSAGSSNSNQIKIPVENGGTYDCTIFWDDGTSDYITAWNDPKWTKTYSSSGVKRIRIKGTFEGFRFNNNGDRLKLLNIKNGGKDFRLGNNNGYLYGCANLTSIKNLNTGNVTTLENAFRGCTSLNSSIILNTNNLTNAIRMFYGCNSFNSNLDLSDMSNVTSLYETFYGCSIFNQPLLWNIENVTTLYATFFNCLSFNQPLLWNTENVNTMKYMFVNAGNFNQNISIWNIENVIDMTSMLLNASSWSTTNYDAFLISAALQSIQPNVGFRCSSNYTIAISQASRDILTNAPNNWTITDLGGI